MIPQTTKISKSYRSLALVFFALLIFITVIRSFFKQYFGEEYLSYLLPVFAPLAIWFIVNILRLIYTLGVDRMIMNGIYLVLAVAVILRILSGAFMSNGPLYMNLSLLSSFLLASVQFTATYFMCVNLFIEETSLIEKLWASVAVYFMIGASFGSIYTLLIFVDSNALGFQITNPSDIVIEGIVHSMNIISGLDPIHGGAKAMVKNVEILESTVITLFLVILIGRLLGGAIPNRKPNE